MKTSLQRGIEPLFFGALALAIPALGSGHKGEANAEDPDAPSGANRVERDRLHEVQPARAGAAAHGQQPAAASPQGERGEATSSNPTAAPSA